MIASRYNSKISFYLIVGSILSFGASIFLLQLFLVLLALMWISEKNSDKRKTFDRITFWILLFGFVRIVSIIFSEYFSISSESFYKEALFYLSFFSFSYYLKLFNKDKIIHIAAVFILSAILSAIIGITQFNLSLVERAQSFSSGFSLFSSFLLTGLGLALCFPKNEVKYFDSYKAVGIAIILSGVITSLGRTNIIISILLLTAALIFKKISVKQGLIISIITAVICLVSFNNNNVAVTQRIEKPVQVSDRDIIYEGALMIYSEHPILGFGPRTFSKIFPLKEKLTDKGVNSWHNDFLQMYFESGILGLTVFISMLIAVVVYLVKNIKKKNKENVNEITWGILFSICGLILSSFTSGFITSIILSIIFSFLIALFSSITFYKDS